MPIDLVELHTLLTKEPGWRALEAIRDWLLAAWARDPEGTEQQASGLTVDVAADEDRTFFVFQATSERPSP